MRSHWKRGYETASRFLPRARPILFALAILAGRGAGAADLDSPLARFQGANAAYKEQNYAEALEAYEALIRDGARDPILYYNAGCALAQMGQKGRATVMFERALKLRPRFPEARQNLKRIGAAPQEAGLFFLFLPFRALFRSMTAEEFFLVAVAGYWLLAAALCAWILLRPGRARFAIAFVAVVCLAVTLFFGAFFTRKDRRERWIEAIVVVDKALSRSGPSEKYSELDLLSEGVKVRQLGLPQDGWVKVQLSEGRIGYLPEQAMEVI